MIFAPLSGRKADSTLRLLAGRRALAPRRSAFHLATLLGILCFVCAPCAWALATAKVRTTLETKGAVWVGQHVTLAIELMSPGFFSGSPTFYLPQVPQVLLLQPNDRPVLGSETIDGASYTIQRHEFAIFAQHPGNVIIPSFQVRFSTRVGTAQPAEHLVSTDAVSFEVKLPPGAEGLATLISARDLKATETWQPRSTKAKEGDAFTRTLTFSAPDVPSMAFPPFPTTEIPGIGVYAKDPRLVDQSERGVMRGERQDIITYVCQRPGRFVLPAARFTWWDLNRQQLRTVDFPARTFEVAANPAFSPPPNATISEKGWKWPPHLRELIVATAAVAILAGFAWWTNRHRPRWWKAIAFWRPIHLAPLNPPDGG
jgi:hypothetical protein